MHLEIAEHEVFNSSSHHAGVCRFPIARKVKGDSSFYSALDKLPLAAPQNFENNISGDQYAAPHGRFVRVLTRIPARPAFPFS